MIYFYLHYGNVNTNQRWKGLVNILHCTCVKIVGVYKVKVIYMYHSFIKKNCIGHGGFLYCSQENIGIHCFDLPHYTSLFVWNLGQKFQTLQEKTLYMFKLKVNIIYQCQYKVKVITLGQRSTLVFLNRILFLSGTFYHL